MFNGVRISIGRNPDCDSGIFVRVRVPSYTPTLMPIWWNEDTTRLGRVS